MTMQQPPAGGGQGVNGSQPSPLMLPPEWEGHRDEAEKIFADYLMESGGNFWHRAHPELLPWLQARKEIKGMVLRDKDVWQDHYRPGMKLPADAEPLREWLDQEYRRQVTAKAHALAIATDARHEMDAQSWKAPEATVSLSDELRQPRRVTPHRIPGLAGMAHNVLVAGPRKTGKSQLLINLSAALSRSGWAQRQPPPAPMELVPAPFLGLGQCWLSGNVAYVNLEMDTDDWLDVFRELPAQAYNSGRIFPLHRRGLPLPVITSKAARDWFITWLRERQIEVLIIDTWGVLCALNGVRNLNDDAEARAVLTGLDEIKLAAGVVSMYISIHMPHQTGERHLERFKGAGAVGDWADTLWTFTADDEGTRFLGAVGRAQIDYPATALDFDPVTGLLSWGTTGTKAQTQASRTVTKILAVAEKAGTDGVLTEALLDAVGGHRPGVRKTVRQMALDSQLAAVTKGRAVRYYLPGNQPS